MPFDDEPKTTGGGCPSGRRLVVNADDFGLSPGVDRGIVEAFERGVVTSASLMVRRASAPRAARRARQLGLDLGLHLDLGEWVWRKGRWTVSYAVVALDDARAVAREIDRQLQRFRSLVGADPTHIDSHQHVHGRQPVLGVAKARAERLGVPLRGHSPLVRFCGAFYGQTGTGESLDLEDHIGVEHLVNLIGSLPEGVTELGCHPGLDPDLDSVYRLERLREVETLTDPRILGALAAPGIELTDFRELGVGAGSETRVPSC